MRREILRIDEEKCDGCGQCVDACAEGAIQMVDGKAKMVSETYCDGLGACIGDCPQGALTIEVREAEHFDPGAVRQHLARLVSTAPAPEPAQAPQPPAAPHACPGSAVRALPRRGHGSGRSTGRPASASPSALGNWPVQIRLLPVNAPCFQGGRLLVTADCVPFAYPDFHRDYLDGRVLLIGCPKLDDADSYRQKLTEIIRQNDIQDVQVGIMEVPCCLGLAFLVREAIAQAGKTIPATLTRFGIGGGICETVPL